MDTLINVDSTIHEPIVSAVKAAKILGVKRETLYAYASRGLLRRARSAGGRSVGYFRSDVERLKARSAARSGHGPVAAGALRWGEPVLESRLTCIDRRGPLYRGHLAVDLAARGATFEQVAELLWTGGLPTKASVWRPAVLPPSDGKIARILQGAHPVARLSLLVPWLAVAQRESSRESSDAELDRARRLVGRMACLLERGEHPSIASAAASSLGAKRRDLEAVNLALVLLADHELNVSSFAARVVASAGAELHACIGAALGAVSGRLHGGECDQVERLLRDVGAPGRAAAWVRDRVKRGQTVSGFGHPLYPMGDPRALPLLDAARAIAPASMATADAVGRAVEEGLGLQPTVDFGLVALAHALGMPSGGAAGLFALGRTAGWVAHVREQREAGYLLRPRARYVGAPLTAAPARTE